MSRVVFFEINTPKPEVTMKFFEEVFDWKFSQFGDQDYWLARTGNDDLPGINGGIKSGNEQKMTNFIEVDSLTSTTKRIQENGGEVLETKEALDLGKMVFFKSPDNIKMVAIEFNKTY